VEPVFSDNALRGESILLQNSTYSRVLDGGYRLHSLDVLVEEEVVDDEFHGLGSVAVSSFLWDNVELDHLASFFERVGEEADACSEMDCDEPPLFVLEVLVGFLQFSCRMLGGWFVCACEVGVREPAVEVSDVLFL